MLTTAGLMRSTMSAKLIAGVDSGFEMAGRVGIAALTGAPAVTAGCEPPPAKIAPTRNATTAVSPTVTYVNRFIAAAVPRGFSPELPL
jgi:hypothetical protein